MAHVRILPDEESDKAEAKLLQAVDSYILAGAVKLYRESQGLGRFRHHTMLFHQAMRVAHHREQAEQLKVLWNTAGYHSPSCLSRMRALYETDMLPVSRAIGVLPTPNFNELLPYISQAIERIGQSGSPVLVVNSDKIEGEALDFDRNEVWRILVGGNKFSRGFTIEGLTVSYYGRATKSADTLMQMGRWFGFREGYQDLVRLYTTPDLYDAFEAVCLDEEYFRNEIKQYANLVQVPDLRQQVSRRPGDLRLFSGESYPDLVKLPIRSGHDVPRRGCDPGRHARPHGPARSSSSRDDLRDGRPGGAGLLPRRRPRDAQHRGGHGTAARLPRQGRRAGDGPDAQLRGHLAPAGAARGRGRAGPPVRAEAEAGPGGLGEGTEVARGRGG